VKLPAAVELVLHAAEVADTREDDRQQAVGELPHAVLAQRDRAADRHVLAQLEARDGLLRETHRRTLTADRREIAHRDVDAALVLDGAVHAHVDHDLREARTA
jgi:hypothetical protein